MKNQKEWEKYNKKETREHRLIDEAIKKRQKMSLGGWLTKFTIDLNNKAENEKEKAKKEWSDIWSPPPDKLKLKK
jgi:hypothetical protein